MVVRKTRLVIATAFITGALVIGGVAFARDSLGTGAHSRSIGSKCSKAVFANHPDLKGVARKAEMDKCIASPTTYFQT